MRGAGTDDNAVFPGEDGELIETSDEVPAGGDVASYEDAEGEDREGVHKSFSSLRGRFSCPSDRFSKVRERRGENWSRY